MRSRGVKQTGLRPVCSRACERAAAAGRVAADAAKTQVRTSYHCLLNALQGLLKELESRVDKLVKALFFKAECIRSAVVAKFE